MKTSVIGRTGAPFLGYLLQALIFLWPVTGSLPLSGQEPKSSEGDEDEDEPEAPRRKPPTEQEKKVLELFHATSKSFEDGKLVLSYNFESRDESQVEDWGPLDTSKQSRIHWATVGEMDQLEGEYSYSSSSRRRSSDVALTLADSGQWVHKAKFVPDLEVKVDCLNLAQPRPATILGPIFFSKSKKLSLGTSGGYQAVCLNGTKPAKAPYPKSEKLIPWKQRETMAYRFSNRVLECFLNEKKSCDTKAVPKFTEGFDVGQAGVAWSGSVKCYLFRVTIKGRLDPDWVAEQLGEKSEKSPKPKPASKSVRSG
jgi:hypothetical protein